MKIREIEIRPREEAKPSEIVAPINISEKSTISGFALSNRFQKATNLKSQEIFKQVSEMKMAQKHISLANRLATDSDGGPVVGENWIKITIVPITDQANAGSLADYIWMYFGRNDRVKLWGEDRTRFPAGHTLTWDLNEVSDFLEDINTDSWDEIFLLNPFGDGILVKRIQICHSGTKILDWTSNLWLDGSRNEKYGRIGLAAQILSAKLGLIRNGWIPQLHWAARELGKTDSRKYGTTNAWCSEFASWCLRKGLWNTPEGDIGSQSMEDYFEDEQRMYTRAQILAKEYVLTEGDYLRFMLSDYHSGLFIRYLDDPNNPSSSTRIETIEGNTAYCVAIRNRTLADVVSAGSTR
ncbi:Uncharacterised protein [uncultured archaeon]|nr:Uncharacterised protein [uncultured archaeon]